MNENIDLTKILKDCPKGTKLYSTIHGEVTLIDSNDTSQYYPISVRLNDKKVEIFTYEGKLLNKFDGECILFPSKEQRDWSKFTAPWLKKESDTIAWFKKQNKKSDDKNEPKFKAGDWLYANELNNYANLIKIVKIVDVFGKKRYKISRDYDSDLDLAEFDFIDKHYHLWTIQDVKDGDVLVNGSNIFIFHFINNRRLMGYCHVNMDDGNFYNDIGKIECFCTIDAPVTPATKEQHDALMKAINNAGYEWNDKTKTLEELIKPKFDPNTLEPFDKVLVRNFNYQIWHADIFSHVETDEDGSYYNVIKDGNYIMVIPYNDDTKHLIGTSLEAPEYYRYWED